MEFDRIQHTELAVDSSNKEMDKSYIHTVNKQIDK